MNQNDKQTRENNTEILLFELRLNHVFCQLREEGEWASNMYICQFCEEVYIHQFLHVC